MPTVVIFIWTLLSVLSGCLTLPLWHIDAVAGGVVAPIAAGRDDQNAQRGFDVRRRSPSRTLGNDASFFQHVERCAVHTSGALSTLASPQQRALDSCREFRLLVDLA